MSEGNVEIVRRLFDATTHRDTATILEYYDPDVEWDNSRFPLGDLMGRNVRGRGHEGLRAAFREWNEAWEDYEYNVEDLIDAGEHVISIVTMRGRGRASGVEVELKHQAGVWTIRDGKVVRVVWFPRRDEALEAAGLEE